MAQNTSVPPSRKPRRWLRNIGFGAGGLLVLLVVVYFVATSGAFFKGVILPKVGAALKANVTVSDASISPFSQVVLRDFKVQTTGAEPLISVQEVRARYSLWDIIGGNIKVAEVALVSPIVTLIKHADGTSNLDPITQAPKSAPAEDKKPAPESPGKPPQIDLGKFALNNATVRVITEHAGGTRDVAELTGVNITLNDLKNGQTGKLMLAADIAVDNKPPAPASAASLQARLDGAFDIGLGNDLSLSAFKGGFKLSVPKAGGALAQLAGFALNFDTDLGADPKQQTAVLRALTLTGSQNQKTFLVANLSSPMTFALGQNANAVGDAALTLTLTNINLADWKAFAPEFDAAGIANASVKITSQLGGKQIGFDLAAQLDNLAALVGTNRYDNLAVTLAAAGQATNLKQYNVTSYRLATARQGDPLATISGSALADTEKQTTDAQLNVDAFLDRLLKLAPQEGVNLTSGRVQMNTKFSQAGGAKTVTGGLGLIGLTGSKGEQRFTNLSVNAAYDVALKNPQNIDLRRFQLALAPTARTATNAVELTGQLDLSKTNALEGTLKLTAETLDVTPYYDLFAGQSAPAPKPATPSQPPSSQPAPPTGDTEPAPIQLPVKLLTFDAKIGRCFLREMDMSNVVANARIEGSRVALKPVQLAINGAPVNSEIDLDLSKPGWKYAIAFNANRLPIEPLANSFSPEYRGRAIGELIANGKIEGAGVTGPNLRKNLAGNLGLSFTNADIQIVGSRLKGFLTPVAAAIKAPGLLNTPLNWVGVDTTVGGGKLNFGQLAMLSPAFGAATSGEIPLADNLSASKISKWPMTMQLSKSLAEKLNLAPKDTPTNALLVALPQFLKVAGTLNDPKPEIDLKALAGAALLQYTDKIPGVDEKTGSLLKELGGLVSGQSKTNTASTNKSPAAGLLDLLNKPKK